LETLASPSKHNNPSPKKGAVLKHASTVLKAIHRKTIGQPPEVAGKGSSCTAHICRHIESHSLEESVMGKARENLSLVVELKYQIGLASHNGQAFHDHLLGDICVT
jgi:hypothetical protein